MKEVVVFKNVSFSYRDSLVLRDVNFYIKENEFVGIIGPNGGGKTTLLKLMMGFLKPASGKIEIFGKPVEASLSKIAYVPQSLKYDREFPISVQELVLSGRLSHLPWYGRYSTEDQTAAEVALKTVGLNHIADQAFGNLSGGQQQRTLIARALASNPELLLLDEPTASVDAHAEADIHSLLQKLKNSMTILIVTHDLKMAIEQVDRVLCVQHELISYSPQEVCEHYAMGLYHPPLMPTRLGKKTP